MVSPPMDALLDQISREHFPNPPATRSEIEEFERRVGWTLDPDLRAFYLHCNGAALLQRLDSPYEILPLSGIMRARVAIRREDTDEWGSPWMYALCYVRDGNYVVLDVSQRVDERYVLIDGIHESWPDPYYCKQIAASFSEFLEEVMRTRRSLYWLGE